MEPTVFRWKEKTSHWAPLWKLAGVTALYSMVLGFEPRWCFFGFWATFTLIKLFNSHPRFSLYVKNTIRIDRKNRKTLDLVKGWT